MSRQRSFTDRVASYFKARPLMWISATELELVGGRQAWRTRVSNARKQHGMRIDNDCRRVLTADGTSYTQSLYRYVPENLLELTEGEKAS